MLKEAHPKIEIIATCFFRDSSLFFGTDLFLRLLPAIISISLFDSDSGLLEYSSEIESSFKEYSISSLEKAIESMILKDGSEINLTVESNKRTLSLEILISFNLKFLISSHTMLPSGDLQTSDGSNGSEFMDRKQFLRSKLIV